MSYTVLYGLDSKKELEELGEYTNSHLAAPTIWNVLARHIGRDRLSYGMDESEMKAFWAVWKLPVVPVFEKIVMLSTYDNAYVSKENIPKLLDAYKEFIKTFPDVNTHIPSYIADIEKADNLNGLCWWTSSIGEDPWFEWDDEDEEVQYDFNSGDKHWELFEYLESFKTEEA